MMQLPHHLQERVREVAVTLPGGRAALAVSALDRGAASELGSLYPPDRYKVLVKNTLTTALDATPAPLLRCVLVNEALKGVGVKRPAYTFIAPLDAAARAAPGRRRPRRRAHDGQGHRRCHPARVRP